VSHDPVRGATIGTSIRQINDAGVRVQTRALLSNRIKISNYLRGVGNVYGASVEEVRIGPSGEFLPEVVDGGQYASGGITPHLVALGQRVRIAQTALGEMPRLRHRVKSEVGAGPHRTLTHRELIDAVCVEGADLTEVALMFGWYVRRTQKDSTEKTSIPKQQSQKLKAALVDGLEVIEAAWSAANIDISRIVGGLEVG
jgi:hypothetical protein